jgi:hypothetical protein
MSPARPEERGSGSVGTWTLLDDIGTQDPFEIWIAIGEKDSRSRSDYPRMRKLPTHFAPNRHS